VAEFLRSGWATEALDTAVLGLVDLASATFGLPFSFDLVGLVTELLRVASGDILLGTGALKVVFLADLGTPLCIWTY
jgi:hypothetical protein